MEDMAERLRRSERERYPTLDDIGDIDLALLRADEKLRTVFDPADIPRFWDTGRDELGGRTPAAAWHLNPHATFDYIMRL